MQSSQPDRIFHLRKSVPIPLWGRPLCALSAKRKLLVTQLCRYATNHCFKANLLQLEMRLIGHRAVGDVLTVLYKRLTISISRLKDESPELLFLITCDTNERKTMRVKQLIKPARTFFGPPVETFRQICVVGDVSADRSTLLFFLLLFQMQHWVPQEGNARHIRGFFFLFSLSVCDERLLSTFNKARGLAFGSWYIRLKKEPILSAVAALIIFGLFRRCPYWRLKDSCHFTQARITCVSFSRGEKSSSFIWPGSVLDRQSCHHLLCHIYGFVVFPISSTVEAEAGNLVVEFRYPWCFGTRGVVLSSCFVLNDLAFMIV